MCEKRKPAIRYTMASLLNISHKPSKLERILSVRSVDGKSHHYEGIIPLHKPSLESRGVYGGNLCAQALVAAMETIGEGFIPHSLHSYFVKAGDDGLVCQFQVEKLNDGKSFANRLVRVLQEGELKYIVMVSMTKKGKKPPIEYQTPVPPAFYKYNHKEMQTQTKYDSSGLLQHRFPPTFLDHAITDEHTKSAGERDLSFWIRISSDVLPKYKYAGFGMVSDLVYLTSLSRILHLPQRYPGDIGVTGGKGPHFFSVSLDHSVYFHDDNFDPSDWTFVNFKAPRLCNNRVLIQGSYYNGNGKLFATIVQEGLVFFHGGSEVKARL